MARQDEDSRWLVSLIITVIVTLLALALVIATHAGRTVHGAYARHGRRRPLMSLMALLYGAVIAVVGAVCVLADAWAAAGLLGGVVSALFVTAAWVLDALWTAAADRVRAEASVNDVSAPATGWWQDDERKGQQGGGGKEPARPPESPEFP